MENQISTIQNNNYIPQSLRSETLTQDPRIDIFFEHFFDRNSHTYLKVYPSAQLAKFTEQEADQIQTRNWFITGQSEFRRNSQNQKADRNLDELLDLDFNKTIFNKDGDEVGEGIDGAALQAKLKATLFVKERLDKEHFSQRIDKTETHNVNIFKVLQQIESSNTPNSKIADFIIDDTGTN